MTKNAGSTKPGKSRSVAALLLAVFCLAGFVMMRGAEASADVMETNDGRKVVYVSTIDEFLDAIAPDTEIVMSPGTYNITKATAYSANISGKYYTWNSYYYPGEYELQISFADNLKITGYGAELVTEPRSVNVLSFYGCYGLRIDGLAVGHTEEAEACEGGVIFLENCNRANIDGCSLYGCGTVGVWANSCSNLTVTNTEIHHCSSDAFYLNDANGLYIGYCKIHDCGKQTAYGDANSVFTIFTAVDAVVEGCEVYNNELYTFMNGWDLQQVSFTDVNVHDNHITGFCNSESDFSFNDLKLSDNSIDSWGGAMSGGSLMVDGVWMDTAQLDLKWGNQLSSYGIGEVDAEYVAVDRTGAAEVHVSTADEFLAAIASDTSIVIDVPQISLMDASSYGKNAQAELWDTTPDFSHANYIWMEEYDGYQLCIGNVSNLHISGGEIITSPRYANVLAFYACSDISLENVRLGHSPEEGSCCGGVLWLQGCNGVILEGCDLYGCGILGITAHNVQNAHVQNTVIHDCSYGAAELFDCDDVTFLGCTVRNCPDPQFFLQNCEGFSWEKKLMYRDCSFNVTDDPGYDPVNYFGYAYAPESETEEADAAQLQKEAAEVCSMVAFAYFHGDMWLLDNYAMSGYEGITEPYQESGDVWFEFPAGMKALNEITPKDLAAGDCMAGLSDITGYEDETTLKVVALTYYTAPDAVASRLYIGLVRYEGEWRVQSFI